MALYSTRRRFTVAEYHQMAEAGILDEDDRVELIEGEVTNMTPIGRRHAACVARLHARFFQAMGDVTVVWGQNPVDLSEFSEPQPDLALLRPRDDFYEAGHPVPEDVLLIVEVADTSTERDRRLKAPLYAQAGIVEFWLVDLEQENVTVYQNPAPSGYRTARVARRGEQLAPSAFPDRPIALTDILG